ncbi:hypothetical protein DFH09DRAFT_1315505 [Mycena vulgaris]|nr:hypothetical protein DFH09DRAFT_1315505 [Mycena vulgaris]
MPKAFMDPSNIMALNDISADLNRIDESTQNWLAPRVQDQQARLGAFSPPRVASRPSTLKGLALSRLVVRPQERMMAGKRIRWMRCRRQLPCYEVFTRAPAPLLTSPHPSASASCAAGPPSSPIAIDIIEVLTYVIYLGFPSPYVVFFSRLAAYHPHSSLTPRKDIQRDPERAPQCTLHPPLVVPLESSFLVLRVAVMLVVETSNTLEVASISLLRLPMMFLANMWNTFTPSAFHPDTRSGLMFRRHLSDEPSPVSLIYCNLTVVTVTY